MKKVAVFGSYNGSSIGDNAILYGILNCLLTMDEEVEIIILTFNKCIELENESLFDFEEKRIKESIIHVIKSDNSSLFLQAMNIYNKFKLKFNLTSIIDKVKLNDELAKCDLLLIGGGNLLMDYYPSWPNMLKDVCSIANKLALPYYLLGVGAGPISRQESVLIFKELIENSGACYVRDNKSKDILSNVGIDKNVSISVDLAFGIESLITNNLDKDRITINLASVYARGWPEENLDKFEAYIDQVLNITNSLSVKYGIKKLEVFSSNYPLDNYACEYFIKRLPDDYKVIYTDAKLSVSDIIRLNRFAVASLVTRLHAGIMASKSCENLYAIVYQPKVETVLKQTGVNVQTFNILTECKEVIKFNCTNKNKVNNLDIAKDLVASIINVNKS